MFKSKSKTKSTSSDKLGVLGLAAIVISSMIGGGIYSLPQNMAQAASVGAVLLAWVVTGIGMYFVANTFRILSTVKPKLTSGIYMYSREGFGNYMGFNIGWSYWLCQIFGNVGYAVITMDALNYFFPGTFTGGNNLYSIIGGSILIWGFNILVLRGVKQATIINLIATVFKIVPLILFIIVLIFMFNIDRFDFDFWGEGILGKTKSLGSIGAQLKSTMLVTLWAFIGIEGAVVLSSRAKSQDTVSKATLLGFLGCLIIYVLLSVVPYGFLSQAQLATISNPSTAGILKLAVGSWGAWIMNIGLLVAVLASWLAWTLIVIEMPYAMAQNRTFPKVFAKSNKNDTPNVSLWVTSIIMQLAMFLVYFSSNAWNTMLSITSVMVLPAYLASTCYLWKICEDGEFNTKAGIGRAFALFTSVMGTLYALWLIYAAGLKYLLLAVVFIAVGIPVYIWARKEVSRKGSVFTSCEKCLVGIILLISIVAIYIFARGIISV